MTKSETPSRFGPRHSSFDVPLSFVIRHSSFVTAATTLRLGHAHDGYRYHFLLLARFVPVRRNRSWIVVGRSGSVAIPREARQSGGHRSESFAAKARATVRHCSPDHEPGRHPRFALAHAEIGLGVWQQRFPCGVFDRAPDLSFRARGPSQDALSPVPISRAVAAGPAVGLRLGDFVAGT